MSRVEFDLARKAHARATFADCAALYIEQSRGQRSIDVIKWHYAFMLNISTWSLMLPSGCRFQITTYLP